MGRFELYVFRFRDPVTGKWVRARYRAAHDEIVQRYAEYEIVGSAEVRDGDPDAPRFTPHVERAAEPTEPTEPRANVAEFQPHLAQPPAIDSTEIALLQLFLRRYVTHCARRRRYAEMQGAALLHGEVSEALGVSAL